MENTSDGMFRRRLPDSHRDARKITHVAIDLINSDTSRCFSRQETSDARSPEFVTRQL